MNQMNQVFVALLLSGFMGLIGQGIRAVVGLKSAATLNAGATAPSQQSQFDAAYFGLSLMIGFIAGVLAGIALGLPEVAAVTVGTVGGAGAAGATGAAANAAPASGGIQILLGIVAAGYAGADFIENAFTNLIPSIGGAGRQAPPGPNAGRNGPPAPPPPPAVDTTPPGIELSGLADALGTVAPQVNASVWSPALSAAFAKYGLTTHRHIAAAVGQFLVEAGAGFQETVENLNYTHADRLRDVFPGTFPTVASAQPYVGNPQAIGNHVYANELGNGTEQSGDGYNFRGRGLIQLTGRAEYAQFAATVGKSINDVVAYCQTPEGAAMSGCWYLSSRGCLPLADSWQLSEITRRVNGSAMRGNAQRIRYSNAMLKALGG